MFAATYFAIVLFAALLMVMDGKGQEASLLLILLGAGSAVVWLFRKLQELEAAERDEAIYKEQLVALENDNPIDLKVLAVALGRAMTGKGDIRQKAVAFIAQIGWRPLLIIASPVNPYLAENLNMNPGQENVLPVSLTHGKLREKLVIKLGGRVLSGK